VADHPLRPATDRSLGRPLPYQLANQARVHPSTRGPEGSPAFILGTCDPRIVWGISVTFASLGTRPRRRYPPLKGRLLTYYSPVRRFQGPSFPEGSDSPFDARLACLIHAVSVQSEPGSNSPLRYLLKPVRKPDSFEEFEAPVGFILLEYLKPNERFRTHAFRLYLVFKERFIPELSRRQRLREKIKSLHEANRNYTPFSYSVKPYFE
jgi:hypothetical protein